MKSLVALAVVAMLMAVSGESGYTLNETWRVPLGMSEVGQYLPLAAVGDVLVAATENGNVTTLHGLDAQSGAHLWHAPGRANLELMKADSSEPGVVFLHFSGGHFEAWNATTGHRIWHWFVPTKTILTDFSILSNSLVFFNMVNETTVVGHLIRLNASTGDLIYSTPVSKKYAISSYWLSAAPEATTLGFDNGYLLTYDTTTGHQKCTFPAAKHTLYMPPGLFVGRYGLLYVDDDNRIYDLLNCSAVSAKFAPGDVAAGFDGKFIIFHTDYNFINRTGIKQFEAALYDVSSRSNKWNVTLPLATEGSSPLFAAGLPFNSGAVFLVANGKFGSYNLTDGSALWKLDHFLPTSKPGADLNLVYPLGEHTLFIPNLMGFVVYDVKHQAVLARIESNPIAGSIALQGASSRPFVVYVELATGDVVAVKRGM